MPLLSMPPLCVNLIIITIFLFLVSSPTSHDADDVYYTTCHEKTYDCGEQIKGVGYPFSGEDRPQFCGVQGLNLTCKGNENTTIVIEKQEFRVLHINRSAHSMTIARADLWDTICPAKFINTTLNWNLLDYSSYPYVVNLTLGYDCPRIFGPPDHPVEERSHFQCQVRAGGQSSNINFFGNESYEWIIQQNCKSRIKVPVFREAVDAFWVDNTITVQELVKQGFVLIIIIWTISGSASCATTLEGNVGLTLLQIKQFAVAKMDINRKCAQGQGQSQSQKVQEDANLLSTS